MAAMEKYEQKKIADGRKCRKSIRALRKFIMIWKNIQLLENNSKSF